LAVAWTVAILTPAGDAPLDDAAVSPCREAGLPDVDAPMFVTRRAGRVLAIDGASGKVL
jgi:hypothetical protein